MSLDSWVLIVVTFMTLSSEPGGGGKFWQTFKGIGTQAVCEDMAAKEAEAAKSASSELVTLTQDHVCMSALEYGLLSIGGFDK